ncbi:MAG: hypothetical protein AB1611_07325 [bacterium]
MEINNKRNTGKYMKRRSCGKMSMESKKKLYFSKSQESGWNLKPSARISIIMPRLSSISILISLTLLILSFFTLLPAKGFPMDLPDITYITQTAREKHENLKAAIPNIALVQESITVTDKDNITSIIKSFKQGEKFRMEAEITSKLNQGKKAITIYDGTDYWTISSGVKTRLSEDMKKKIQTTAERKWWDLLPDGAEIKGIEKIDESECYLIAPGKVSPPKVEKNSINRLWIDKEKLMLRKVESIGLKGEIYIMVISDFRTIKDNIEIPFKVMTYKDNKLVSTVTTKSCEINNGGFPSKYFDANAEQDINIKEVIKELFD